MNVSLHTPEKVSVIELERSSGIVLIITDNKGNDSKVFFKDYQSFFNFSKIIRQGGTYGIEYSLESGEQIAR